MIGTKQSNLMLACCSFLVIAAAPSAFAQVPNDDEMQRIIQQQQAQIEAQQAQLDAQQQMLEQLQAQMQALASTVPVAKQAQPPAPAAEPKAKPPQPGAPPEAVAASAPKASEAPPATPVAPTAAPFLLKSNKKISGRPDQGPRMLEATSGHDLDSPTGSNVSPNPIAEATGVPVGATKLNVFGFTQFQMAFDSNYLDASEFDVYLLDVDGSDSGTTFSVNPSRFGFSTVNNLGFGRVNTLLSVDFNDELDGPSPRLRQVYGEFIQDDQNWALLAGQVYTTGLDLKAAPETLDFAGPSGAFARRQPMLRFSKLFGREWLLDVALETPDNAAYRQASRQTRYPDLYVAAEWDARQPYLDHIRIMGLLRDLKAEDDLGNNDNDLGWAVGASTKIKLPLLGPKDNFKLTLQYGEGYGAMIKSGPFDGDIDPATGDLETVRVFSAFGGVQHFWSDILRSNLSFGHVDADSPSFFADDNMDNNVYVAGNLIWEPFTNSQFGVEYLYGRRENIDGNSGDGDRLLLSSKFNF